MSNLDNRKTQKDFKPFRSVLSVVFWASFLSINSLAIPETEETTFRFRRISNADGLSQNSVTCFLQDSKGFMWIGTQNGLNRYDGYDFSIYKHSPSETNSLSNGFIRTILEDRSGKLWIGTEGGGLNRHARGEETFTSWRNDPEDPTSLSHDAVRAVYEDSEGILWIGTWGGGLNRFDPDTGKFERWRHDSENLGSLSSDFVRTIHEDESGALWIGTWGGGLNRFEKSSGQFAHWQTEAGNPNSLIHDEILSLFISEENILWIGTMEGLDRFDPQRQEFTHWLHDPSNPNSLSNNIVISLHEDRSGYLWIGTFGGALNRFDRQRNEFVHWTNDPNDSNSLSQNKVRAIYEDQSGLLWFGTDLGGINTLDPHAKPFFHYKMKPDDTHGLNDNSIWALYTDQIGNLWIGTDEGGLNMFDPQKETVQRWMHEPGNPSSLSHNSILALCGDVTGDVWIGTNGGGLNKYDPQKNKFTSWKNDPADPRSLGDNYIVSLYMDRANDLWIGTWGGGLDKYDRDGNHFEHWKHESENPNSLSDDEVFAIYEDQSGTLWIGTHGGLNRFNREEGTFKRYMNVPGNLNSISFDRIRTIYEDRLGTLWIGTDGGGLNQFDRVDEKFTRFTEKDGLANDVVFGILEDGPGNLWLSTNKGLSRFDPKTKTFKNYDLTDGLQDNEFNMGAYHKSSKGELFFGGINGFNSFLPENIVDNPHVPPIVIKTFKTFDTLIAKDIQSTFERRLSHQDKYFLFEFVALDFRNPEKNQFAYKMDGFDEDWIYPKNQNFASYTKLDPGAYTFRVLGSNNDDVWNEAGVSVSIVIPPPFWQTWWFRAVATVLLFGLAVFIHKRRVNNIEAKKLLLETQVAVRTSELAEKNLELEGAFKKLKDTQAQLVQSEKMASLGNLAAGVAHEINSPVGAINSAADNLIRSIDKITQALESGLDIKEIQADPRFKEALDILKSNSNLTVMASERITKIVQSLRNFARLDESEYQKADIHPGIETTLILLHYRIKDRITVKKEFGNIPKICCYANQLNQVFMNVLVNAVQAIGEKGTIAVKTWKEGDKVVVSVSDDGKGIKEENLRKVFDPGFTTKGVGVGSGLGLSISYNIIKDHGGDIDILSKEGKGAEVLIRLPVK